MRTLKERYDPRQIGLLNLALRWERFGNNLNLEDLTQMGRDPADRTMLAQLLTQLQEVF